MKTTRPEFHPPIEGLRFVAAFGIVWFHMQAPGQPYAYAALAVFLALTADLSLGVLDRGGPRVFLRRRLVRVGLPWVVWSAFYLAVGLATGVAMPDFLGDWRALLIGPEMHLWFLPFVLLASGLVLGVKLWADAAGSPNGPVILMALASFVALVAQTWGALPAPFAQWAFALPPFLLGLVMALARRFGAAWLEPAFLFAVIGLSLATQSTEGLLQLLIAWPVLWVVWRLPPGGNGLVELGGLSFGIYLIHPFLALVLFKFAPWAEGRILGVVGLFVVSALAVAVLRRVPGLRAIV